MTLQCLACGRDIPHREPYVSVSYQIEQTDSRGVTVDEAEMLLLACDTCAPSRSAVADALRSAGWPAGSSES